MYETISETEYATNIENVSFNPNYFIDITPFLEEKLTYLKFTKQKL